LKKCIKAHKKGGISAAAQYLLSGPEGYEVFFCYLGLKIMKLFSCYPGLKVMKPFSVIPPKSY